MSVAYNLSISVYQLAIKLVAPFNLKAKQWVDGRKNIFENIAAKIDGNDRPLVWVHCASLGEFEQGRPLIEKIKQDYPEYHILLTFFSPSGYEIRKNYDLADYVFYLPADTARNARRFIDLVKPTKVFFVKYEFWYNYINELKTRDIPFYVISAIFREDQKFFSEGWVGRWFRKLLFKVTHFFVQNEHSAKLLANIGLNNYTIAGDTRFDRVAEIAAKGKQIPLVEKFKGDRKLVVAGSSWKPDEELLVRYINKHDGAKFIFAPHEIKPQNLERLISSLKKPCVRFSEAGEEDINNAEILLIDSIGLLSSVYRYADVAYIGGGFGVGIHNTLEAAIFNIPVIFGPNYKKFNEAVMLATHNVAHPISDYETLREKLDLLLSDDQLRAEIAVSCRSYIQSNLGATQTITGKVFNS